MHLRSKKKKKKKKKNFATFGGEKKVTRPNFHAPPKIEWYVQTVPGSKLAVNISPRAV